MHRGYVKIWRKIFDTGIQTEHLTFTLWIWLLCNVTRKELNYIIRGECIKLNPGEMIIGRKKLSKELACSEQNVRTCLHHLEAWGNITIRATNRFSILKINNWDIYQECDSQINQQSNQEVTKNQPRSNQELTTKQESKEIENKDIYSPSCEPNLDGVSKNGNIPYGEIQAAFNEILVDMPIFRDMTPARKKAIKSRWNTDEKTKTLEWWVNEFFPLIAESEFLTGRSGKWTSCNIDWILKPSNFQKIREGTYNR
jgi:hypothetical protein